VGGSPLLERSYELSAEASFALNSAVEFISEFIEYEQACDKVSPFLPHYIYMAASTYLTINFTLRTDAIIKKLDVLKHGLRLMNGRWLSAGMFVTNITELIYITANVFYRYIPIAPRETRDAIVAHENYY
jgi:hypothetical protein